MSGETWQSYVFSLRSDGRHPVLVKRGGWRKSHPGPWLDVATFSDWDDAQRVLALLPQPVEAVGGFTEAEQ